MDWESLKTFLAIARSGSLSAAARGEGLTQTTMGRRLASLEAELGARLLQRGPRGHELTPAGERILAQVEGMEQAALAVERIVAGADSRLEGPVRITSVEAFAARILTPILARLRRSHPGISVLFDADDRSLSLARREADLAVRLAPFAEPDTIVRRVGAMAFGAYASHDYLAAEGTPDWASGAAGHSLITVREELLGLPEARWLSGLAANASVALRANSRQLQLRAAIEGLGVACLPRYLADSEPRLVRLQAPDAPRREIWLGYHADSRRSARLRAVIDHVSTGLAECAGLLDPVG